MKRRALFVICLSFIFISNSLAQTQSQTDAFNKFWGLAVKNDFETAQKQIATNVSKPGEIQKIKQNFQLVSANGLKLLDFRLNKIALNQAFFSVVTKDKNGDEKLFQMTMTKINDDWKISAFDYLVVVNVYGDSVIPNSSNIPSNPNQPFGQDQQPNASQFLLLEPYNAEKNPIEFVAKPYYPNQNPLQYNKFVPKPK